MYRRIGILSLLVILALNLVFSQQPEWERPILAGKICKSIAKDSESNLYSFGEINNNIQLQTYFNQDSLSSYPNYWNYGFIVKSDERYNVKWIKYIESLDGFYASKIEVDSNNDVLVFGKYFKSIRIDSLEITSPENESRFLVAKFSSSGELLWYKSIGVSESYINAIDLKINSKDEIFVAGNASGQLTFYKDSGDNFVYGNINTSKRVFYAKYNADGSFIAAKVIPEGYNKISLNGMDLDKNGSVYLTGYWWYGGNIDGVEKIPDESMIFIAKFDSTNQLAWLKQIGDKVSTTHVAGKSIVVDEKLNSVYVTGNFLGEADFGGITLKAEDENIFLARYSLSGELKWVQKFGSWSGAASSTEYGENLMVDSNGLIYLQGNVGEYGFLNNAVQSTGEGRLFISCITANGNFLWTKLIDTAIYDLALEESKIIICGSAYRHLQFGEYNFEVDHPYEIGYIGKLNMPNLSVFELSEANMLFKSDTLLSDTIEIVSNNAWNLEVKADWVHVDKLYGIGNDLISFSVDTNHLAQDREAIFKFYNEGNFLKGISIEQSGNEGSEESVTSVDLNTVDEIININPNPTQGLLYISSRLNLSEATFIVSDIFGRKVFMKNGHQEFLDISKFPCGFYFIEIEIGNGKYSKKILKN